MPDLRLLVEAERRGILPPERRALLAEARRRGLVPDSPRATSPDTPSARPGTLEGVARAAGQGVTFGFGDEIAGGVQALGRKLRGDEGSLRDLYDEEVASEREQLSRFREANPAAALGSEVAGTLPTLLIPGAGAARGASLAARGARAVGSGVAGAGLYGVGAGEGGAARRLASGAAGAAAGAAFGGLGRAAGKVVQAGAARKAGQHIRATAPTTKALKEKGSELFEAARESGEEVGGDLFNSFVKVVKKDLKAEGVDKVLHPKVARALRNMTTLGRRVASKKKPGKKGEPPTVVRKEKPLNFQELYTLRRNLALGGRSLEPDERRLSKRALRALDSFVENQAADAGVLSKKARNVWSRMRKAELIEETIEKAKSRAAGVEAGLRNEFSKLYRNKKLMRGFSATEKKAIEAVSKGNPVSSALRILGGLSIGEGQRRNILAGLAGIATGGAVGGVGGAVAAPLIGMGAQRLAQRGTMNRAQVARALAATGGRPAALPANEAARLARASRLAEILSGQSGRFAVPGAVLAQQGR